MADREEPRFTPPYRGAARATSAPDWFVREAVKVFGLALSDVAVFYAIADNLDSDGASRTAVSLIADRLDIRRQTASDAIARLVGYGLLIELDPKRSGAIMRYAIPRHRPLTRAELPV